MKRPNRSTWACLIVASVAATLLLGCKKAVPPNIKNVGGTRLVFGLDGTLDVPAAEAVKSVRKRLEPFGTFDAQVVGETIEIECPGKQPGDLNVPLLQRAISSASTLNLRILAEQSDPIAARASTDAVEGSEVLVDGVVVGKWVPIWIDGKGLPRIQIADKHVVRVQGDSVEALLLVSPLDVGSQQIKAASVDNYESQPVLNFLLDESGSELMQRLTSRNIGRQLAIVVGDEIATAPVIMSKISDRGQINGNFTEEEVMFMASLIASGPLPFEITDEPPKVIPVPAPTATNP